ncbi:unnamed protein product [Polarella glacialis]|uniref:Uncharacterized protein n=1 Tax=Polarella glacialis TaxID=89957 RepID=A0A813HNC6_POLGL|nr:unnamed protein product [Polarella glacialis]
MQHGWEMMMPLNSRKNSKQQKLADRSLTIFTGTKIPPGVGEIAGKVAVSGKASPLGIISRGNRRGPAAERAPPRPAGVGPAKGSVEEAPPPPPLGKGIDEEEQEEAEMEIEDDDDKAARRKPKKDKKDKKTKKDKKRRKKDEDEEVEEEEDEEEEREEVRRKEKKKKKDKKRKGRDDEDEEAEEDEEEEDDAGEEDETARAEREERERLERELEDELAEESGRKVRRENQQKKQDEDDEDKRKDQDGAESSVAEVAPSEAVEVQKESEAEDEEEDEIKDAWGKALAPGASEQGKAVPSSSSVPAASKAVASSEPAKEASAPEVIPAAVEVAGSSNGSGIFLRCSNQEGRPMYRRLQDEKDLQFLYFWNGGGDRSCEGWYVAAAPGKHREDEYQEFWNTESNLPAPGKGESGGTMQVRLHLDGPALEALAALPDKLRAHARQPQEAMFRRCDATRYCSTAAV